MIALKGNLVSRSYEGNSLIEMSTLISVGKKPESKLDLIDG